MTVKIRESQQQGVRRYVAVVKGFIGRAGASLAHPILHFNRKHKIAEDLKKRLNDERFLSDVGLERAQVQQEIKRILRSKA